MTMVRLLPARLMTALLVLALANPVVRAADALPDKVASIFKNHCERCHVKGPKFRSDVNLGDPAHVRKLLDLEKPANSKLLKLIATDPAEGGMPPADSGYPPVSAAEVKTLEEWVATLKPTQPDPTLPVKVLATPLDIFTARCKSCHSGSSPKGGLRIPEDLSRLARQRKVGKILQVVRGEGLKTMPPPPRDPLSAEDIQVLADWVRKGAPALVDQVPAELLGRKVVGEGYVLQTILDDIKTIPIQLRSQYRYFSFNHLINAGISESELQNHRDAFLMVLNHLTWQPDLEIPRPAGGDLTRTVYRVSISNLGWDRKVFRTRTGIGVGKDAGPSDLTAFDLVLLEYPYGVRYTSQATQPIFQELLESYLNPQGKSLQLAPLPYVRADWFLNTIARSPHYEDLLQLPKDPGNARNDLKELETRLRVQAGLAERAGAEVSGVSRNNRVIERRRTHMGGGYYWVSYDYANNAEDGNMLANPVDLNPAGGEMIFSLPNGMQGYYIADGKGRRLEAAPTFIVSDPHASDKVVRNGLACIRCHEKGMNPITDDVRPALDALGLKPIKFNLDRAKELYPGQERIDQLLKKDGAFFQQALARLFSPQNKGTGFSVSIPAGLGAVLDEASRRYLDDALDSRSALAELDTGDKYFDRVAAGLFAMPNVEPLGVQQLVQPGGLMRRDAWDRAFPLLVHRARLGEPLLPLNAASAVLREYSTADTRNDLQAHIELKGGQKVNAVPPRSEVRFFLKNASEMRTYFVELVLSTDLGRKQVAFRNVKLAPGDSLFYPPRTEQGLIVDAGASEDQFTVYGSTAQLPDGQIVRLADEELKQGQWVDDRYVHPIHGAGAKALDPETIVKKTLVLKTQP